jgi:Fe-S-cluster-containing dehydrogenase component
MTAKWNMIVDVERCNNCRACFLAVKDEHTGNDFPGYAAEQPSMGHNWLDIERKERGSYPIVDAHFRPVMCNHCDDAPCMKVAKNGAITKRDDGIVIIHPEKAKGQKEIVDACPYGAVSWNEDKQIPQAWIFDAHLLDNGWDKTRAEQCCPTDVFKSVKVEDSEMQAIAAAEGLQVLQPELGTKPRIYYKNMHFFDKCFVGGTVVTSVDGVEDCLADAQVIVRQAGDEVGRATSDAFGEFRIDKLAMNSGAYELEVTGALGSCTKQFDISDTSVYLGVLTVAA